jgi:hypothetical protein
LGRGGDRISGYRGEYGGLPALSPLSGRVPVLSDDPDRFIHLLHPGPGGNAFALRLAVRLRGPSPSDRGRSGCGCGRLRRVPDRARRRAAVRRPRAPGCRGWPCQRSGQCGAARPPTRWRCGAARFQRGSHWRPRRWARSAPAHWRNTPPHRPTWFAAAWRPCHRESRPCWRCRKPGRARPGAAASLRPHVGTGATFVARHSSEHGRVVIDRQDGWPALGPPGRCRAGAQTAGCCEAMRAAGLRSDSKRVSSVAPNPPAPITT